MEADARERSLRDQPGPPHERTLGRKDYPVFTLLSLAGLAALAAFARVWLDTGLASERPVVFGLLSLILGVVLANGQGRWYLLLPMRRPLPIDPPPELWVAVATTYVPGAEPRAMLQASLEALVGMEHPHDTWLLDDGGDPDARGLCEELGVGYFSRVDHPEYSTPDGPFKARSKHGNYNAWLDAVGYGRYDALVAFDPDHVPAPDFLSGVLGYLRYPSIGYVQAAQAYYNQDASLVARGAAEETYAHYSSVQMAAYGMGYPIIVGSHNTHRMEALREAGGFAAHDADDLLLTLRYRSLGWEGVYVPRILARGLAPVDWCGYLTQQRRWARSVLDIKLRRQKDYSAKLPLRSRIMSFLHGINFLHRSLVMAGALGILLFLLVTRDVPPALSEPRLLWTTAILGVALLAQEAYRQRFYLDPAAEAGLHWRTAVLTAAKWPWFLLALGDAIAGHRPPYALTWKSTRTSLYRPFVAFHTGVAAAVAAAAIGGWMIAPSSHPWLDAAAAAVFFGSTALVLTELRGFPPPFDGGLLSRWLQSRDRDPLLAAPHAVAGPEP